MSYVGDRLRELREKKGLSLDDLSRVSGVTRDHIGRIERGESQNPREQTIEALSKALDIHPSLLLYGVINSANSVIPMPNISDDGVGALSKEERETILELRTITDIEAKKNIRGMIKTIAKSFSK